MNDNNQRNLGTQPISQIMAEHNLRANDLVKASTEQITHKMVARACKGRKLTPNVQSKILKAINNAADKNYSMRDLFNY